MLSYCYTNNAEQWRIHWGAEETFPRFQAEGDSHAKVLPLFDTQ